MRLAEVLLRIGSALVAWMMLYTYFLWLALLTPKCENGGDDLFALLTFMAVIAIGASLLLRVTRPLPEIHQILRWLGLPVCAIALLAIPRVLQTLNTRNFSNGRVSVDTVVDCAPSYWAPLQLVTVLFCIWMIFTLFRPTTRANK